MLNYSEGAWGLSVLLQYDGIFTTGSISLRCCWRQWDSRYFIHTGRYLIVKWLRYLRTVRYTAADYCNLYYSLLHGANNQYCVTPCHAKWITFTSQLLAEVRLYTSLLYFAEFCVFDKQSPPPIQHLHYCTPSPNVTGLICRVPSAAFTHYFSILYQSTSGSFGTI